MLVHLDSIWFTLFTYLPNWVGRVENVRIGDNFDYVRINPFCFNFNPK